jgi:hypothetical protein
VDEPEIIVSKLSTRVQIEDVAVDIDIYRLDSDEAWTLEIVDEGGGSTVWDDKFPTDEVALTEALRALEEGGIESFTVKDSLPPTIH